MGSRVAVTGQTAGRSAYSAAGTWFVSFPVSPSCAPLAIPLLSEQCKHTAPEECWTLWPHSKRSSAVHSVQPGRAVLRESVHTHTHTGCQISSCSRCCSGCHCAHELQRYLSACNCAHSAIYAHHVCFQVWQFRLRALLVWMNSNHPSPLSVGCTPHARLDRAVPLGIGQTASSKRLSGQRPADRSGLAKDRSKQTASVSVCKGSVKWMFDLLSLAPAAFRAASSVSELWWDVSGFGHNHPDVQLWPKYEAMSVRLYPSARCICLVICCGIHCISSRPLFQQIWSLKYFFHKFFSQGF